MQLCHKDRPQSLSLSRKATTAVQREAKQRDLPCQTLPRSVRSLRRKVASSETDRKAKHEVEFVDLDPVVWLREIVSPGSLL